MALKSVLETLDGVDDALKAEYVEKDGKFVLDLDVDNHPEVQGLKTANLTNSQKARDRQSKIDELEGRLKAIPEDFDSDVWDRAKSGKLDDAAVAAKIAEVRTALEAERDGYKTELDGLKAQSQQDKIQKAVLAALADSKVPDGPREAAALAVLNGQKVEVNGADVIIETDMGPKTVNDFVKSWVSGPGQWAVPKASGGDAKGGGNGGGSGAPASWGDAKTPAEKAAYLKSKRE